MASIIFPLAAQENILKIVKVLIIKTKLQTRKYLCYTMLNET